VAVVDPEVQASGVAAAERALEPVVEAQRREAAVVPTQVVVVAVPPLRLVVGREDREAEAVPVQEEG
jgi:hypothetical protein